MEWKQIQVKICNNFLILGETHNRMQFEGQLLRSRRKLN